MQVFQTMIFTLPCLCKHTIVQKLQLCVPPVNIHKTSKPEKKKAISVRCYNNPMSKGLNHQHGSTGSIERGVYIQPTVSEAVCSTLLPNNKRKQEVVERRRDAERGKDSSCPKSHSLPPPHSLTHTHAHWSRKHRRTHELSFEDLKNSRLEAHDQLTCSDNVAQPRGRT